jgi:DNA-binding NtrC family response regulator
VTSLGHRSSGTNDRRDRNARNFSQTMKKSARLRILVVDDEPLIRWSLTETLTESGHAVTDVGDGKSAIRELSDRERIFDVVFLDFRLPDSNDLSLLSTVRRMAPNAAVIMMTAYGTPEMTTGALDLGAFRVVPKPFEVHDMPALVIQAHEAAARHR